MGLYLGGERRGGGGGRLEFRSFFKDLRGLLTERSLGVDFVLAGGRGGSNSGTGGHIIEEEPFFSGRRGGGIRRTSALQG